MPGTVRLSDVLKRLIDIWAAAAGLLVLSPILAATAVALLVAQGRPILFRQQRPGRGGVPFSIAKFRTMRVLRRGEVAYRTDELRVTTLGRVLRATSIDELPELWNVIRGEMSLVGPRPLLMEYLATYTERQRRRHEVRPGVTSWAAVNGRHVLRFEERIELDVWYVEHRSLRLDFRIIVMTIQQVLARTAVSAIQDPDAIGFPLPGPDAGADPAPSPPGAPR